MSKTRFSTDRQVAALKPDKAHSRTDYFHTTETGFICRVSKSNKSWMVSHMVKVGGKTSRRKVTIGSYPDISLADALAKAKEIKSDARNKGVDIVGDRNSRKRAPTISDLMDHYFMETTLAASSFSESKRIYDKDINPVLGNLIAIDITRQDVKDLHRSIQDRGASIAANRTIELLRRAYNCAEEEELIPFNPFPNIGKIKTNEVPRDTVLRDFEIKTLWLAMDNEKPNMRDILRLLLLLGQRSTETMSMRVEDIDRDRQEWTVPAKKTKNGKTNLVPLPPLAWGIIEPRLENKEWIFPSSYNRTKPGAKLDGHTKSTKDARRRLRIATGIKNWTGHDLRRTCRTIMSREGVLPHVAKLVLGHSLPGMDGIYDQHSYIKEKRKALEKVENAIRTILGMKSEKTKIISIKENF